MGFTFEKNFKSQGAHLLNNINLQNALEENSERLVRPIESPEENIPGIPCFRTPQLPYPSNQNNSILENI